MQGLFNKGFTDKQLKRGIGREHKKLAFLLTNCLQNKSLLQFNAMNEDTLKIKLQERGMDKLFNRVRAFNKKFQMSLSDIKSYLAQINPRMDQFLDVWKKEELKTIQLTSVGCTIARLNYNRVTGANLSLT